VKNAIDIDFFTAMISYINQIIMQT